MTIYLAASTAIYQFTIPFAIHSASLLWHQEYNGTGGKWDAGMTDHKQERKQGVAFFIVDLLDASQICIQKQRHIKSEITCGQILGASGNT